MICTAHVENSTRTFNCALCRRLVQTCRSCDRGHRYCSPKCGNAARNESVRRAGRRYRQTEAGRLKNAERQRRFRERQRARLGQEPGSADQRVTHARQPAPSQEPSGLPPDDGTRAAVAEAARPPTFLAPRLSRTRRSGQQRPRRRRSRPPSAPRLRRRCAACRRPCCPFTRLEFLRPRRPARRPGGLQRPVRGKLPPRWTRC